MSLGVCHADDLMYIFNLDVPLVLCNLEEVMRKSFAGYIIKII